MTSVSSSGFHWQVELEGDRSALARHALGGDHAPVQLHNRFDDGQSQSHPRVALRACRVDPIETVENLWQMFRSNANARITDPDRDGVVIRGVTDRVTVPPCGV